MPFLIPSARGGHSYGIMAIIKKTIQPREALCISYSGNTIGDGMNPTIPPSKYV